VRGALPTPDVMTDRERLDQLITARHPCVAILTPEESHALDVVREAALERSLDLSIWSITTGLHGGIIDPPQTIPDTENPAAALFHLAANQRTRAPGGLSFSTARRFFVRSLR